MEYRHITEDTTHEFYFNTTRFSSGAPFTLAGTPSVYARVDGSATEITTGITLDEDFDSKTGQHKVTWDSSSSASYAAGSLVAFFIAAGTVDSVSVADLQIGPTYKINASGNLSSLISRGLLALPNAAADAAGGLPISDAGGLDLDAQIGTKINDILTDTGTTLDGKINTAQADLDILTGTDGVTLATAQANYAPLKPTVADRTLDVSAAGNAGIDWGNVEAPTTTVDLSGTTIAITQKVDLHTIKTVNVSSAAPGSIRFYGYIGVNSAPGASGGATVVDSIDGVVKASPAPTTTGFDATFAVAPETGVLNDRELQISFAGSSVNQSALPVATYTKIDSTTGRFTFDEAFSITPASSDVVKVMLRHTHPVTQIQDGLGTAAELAKVPKSDGTVGWNATARAEIQTEAADAITAASLPTLAQILAGGDIDGYTLEQFCKLALAALGGKVSGAGTDTEVFRAADDSKARITATVDSSGNRSAITLDATG